MLLDKDSKKISLLPVDLKIKYFKAGIVAERTGDHVGTTGNIEMKTKKGKVSFIRIGTVFGNISL